MSNYTAQPAYNPSHQGVYSTGPPPPPGFMDTRYGHSQSTQPYPIYTQQPGYYPPPPQQQPPPPYPNQSPANSSYLPTNVPVQIPSMHNQPSQPQIYVVEDRNRNGITGTECCLCALCAFCFGLCCCND
ncbi:hypothetical protein SSS_10180 [Sarcoptes scabiei]|uniref:Uncharacterized protein n=1 Tax=Sarcoptes scabiei TaxID=52283 RepID=A0A834R8U1_SARSC|nr:hypothetical protein SSS_10180 [Sarcoptes scabiei]